MSLIKIFSHLLAAWVAFLYPCFASYKALSHRPVSEPDLERWVKYWAVIAALVGTEYALEWIISWVPLYWELKTVFILYLALPQTQGSTFIYDSYLAPYFIRNEASIDAAIATAKSNMFIFLRERLNAFLNFIWGFASRVVQAAQAQPRDGSGQAPTGSPFDIASNLWRTYGSSLVAGFSRVTTSFGQAAPQNPSPPQSSGVSTPATQPQPRAPFSASDAE